MLQLASWPVCQNTPKQACSWHLSFCQFSAWAHLSTCKPNFPWHYFEEALELHLAFSPAQDDCDWFKDAQARQRGFSSIPAWELVQSVHFPALTQDRGGTEAFESRSSHIKILLIVALTLWTPSGPDHLAIRGGSWIWKLGYFEIPETAPLTVSVC